MDCYWGGGGVRWRGTLLSRWLLQLVVSIVLAIRLCLIEVVQILRGKRGDGESALLIKPPVYVLLLSLNTQTDPIRY